MIIQGFTVSNDGTNIQKVCYDIDENSSFFVNGMKRKSFTITEKENCTLIISSIIHNEIVIYKTFEIAKKIALENIDTTININLLMLRNLNFQINTLKEQKEITSKYKEEDITDIKTFEGF